MFKIGEVAHRAVSLISAAAMDAQHLKQHPEALPELLPDLALALAEAARLCRQIQGAIEIKATAVRLVEEALETLIYARESGT